MGLMTWKVCVAAALIYGLVLMTAYADSAATPDLIGEWGGEHIQMTVTKLGATVDFDCALGAIDEPLLPDKDGNFEVRGTYALLRGGPVRPDEPPPKKQAALYRGWTNGKEMRLTVTLVDTGREVGTFSLGLGGRPLLERCL